MSDRELFRIVLRPEPGVDGLRALRAALRTLLRRHGLKCVAVRCDPPLLEHEHAPPVLIDGAAERVAKKMADHDQ